MSLEQLSPELVSILAVGVALAGLILTGLRGVRAELHVVQADLRGELRGARSDVADLRERMARLEGLFAGFIRNVSPGRIRLELKVRFVLQEYDHSGRGSQMTHPPRARS